MLIKLAVARRMYHDQTTNEEAWHNFRVEGRMSEATEQIERKKQPHNALTKLTAVAVGSSGN